MTGTADRVAGVLDQIDEAAKRAGRSGKDITLVAVSKTFPAERIIEVHEAGINHFGENKAQEFATKVEELSGYTEIDWHFVGHLQRNKAKLVVGSASLFHALDSERLARTVDSLADRLDLTIDCLIQVNVSGEKSKFGVDPGELPRLIETVSGLKGITIRGLMTLASPSDEPSVRSEFALLRRLGQDLCASHPDASILSMGMSGDFEIAVEEGATHVRIGSAIFGPRAFAVGG